MLDKTRGREKSLPLASCRLGETQAASTDSSLATIGFVVRSKLGFLPDPERRTMPSDSRACMVDEACVGAVEALTV